MKSIYIWAKGALGFKYQTKRLGRGVRGSTRRVKKKLLTIGNNFIFNACSKNQIAVLVSMGIELNE